MNSKIRVVAVAFVWLVILGLIVLGYRYFWSPRQEQKAKEQAEREHKETIDLTSAESRYKHTINFGIDSFSGYAIFRHKSFQDELGKYEIKVNLLSDIANYSQRLQSLAEGKLDLAVFTIDALIKSSANLGDFPATIIAMIDETKGADALIGAAARFPNLDALNNPDVKIICTADSPSETLARVVMHSFNLKNMSKNPFEFVDGAEAVFAAYQKSRPTDNKLFALWEPYVSKIASNPDYRVLINSSKFRGYIVDVIVVRRGFLLKNEAQVEAFVKSYYTTSFNQRPRMLDLVIEDANELGQSIEKDQAKRLVEGIWWKNTQESFGHFGFTNGHGLQHIEEMCANITKVLLSTGSISKDPTEGKPNKLFYDGILRKLFSNSWHPGFGDEGIRKEKALAALSDEEWKELKPVGTLQVPRLVFNRGTSQLSTLSYKVLDDLAETLKTFPQYYLVVRGNVSAEGDIVANKSLAEARAKTAVVYLMMLKAVDKNRIRADTSNPNGSSTVAFLLGELPY